MVLYVSIWPSLGWCLGRVYTPLHKINALQCLQLCCVLSVELSFRRMLCNYLTSVSKSLIRTVMHAQLPNIPGTTILGSHGTGDPKINLMMQ